MNNLFNQNGIVPQNQPINPLQFQQLVPRLTDDALQQIIQQARAQGIPEREIQEGLNFINNMR